LDWEEEEEEDDKERGPPEDAAEEAAAVADALMLSSGNWPVFQRSASIWLLLMTNLPRPGSKTSLQKREYLMNSVEINGHSLLWVNVDWTL
jgi:hypothetical protein